MSDNMKFYMAKENSMYFNHLFAVDPLKFKNNTYLDKFFDITTINYDKLNNPFVSSIEAKKYPIYGT